MTSQIPSHRARWLLFGAFVLIVAFITFLTLYMIKPIEIGQEQKIALSSPPEQTGQEETLSKPSTVSGQDNRSSTPKTDVISERQTLAGKVDDKAQSAQLQKPANDKVDSKPTTAPVASGQGFVSIQTPEFKKTSRGWQMIIRATTDVDTKHFVLKSPPRLVIDFNRAEYGGSEATLDSPIPSISRVRIGEDPKHTRVVIDFKGEQLPEYRVETHKNAITVIF